jgi:hypothetical protein
LELDAGEPSRELVAEVGYLELGERHYRIAQTELTASSAGFFYSFHPAEREMTDAPLLVLSGGGPAASVFFLLAYHAPSTIAPGAAGTPVLAPNPASLTRLGHVLSIDARNAGFSHGLLADPSNRAAREHAFGVQDYNPFRDAADHWQSIFAFFELHPELRHSPLYFLTESYGAVRVSIMLDLLIRTAEYESGQRAFFDPDLMAQLGEYKTDDGERSIEGGAAAHVHGQMLLEPWFAGFRQASVAAELFEQPGSVMDQLAAETGAVYTRCGAQSADCDAYDNALRYLLSIDRSVYDYRASSAWLDDHVGLVSGAVTRGGMLSALTGVQVPALEAVLGRGREGAYRFADPAHGLFVERGDLDRSWGELPLWDMYFLPLNVEAQQAFASDPATVLGTHPNQVSWGELLLDNVRSVPTFVSRASYDLLAYGPALVPVLATYPDVARAELVAAPGGSEIRIDFMDGTGRAIISPEYASSHSVSRDQPSLLLADIAGFLAEQGD